MGASFWLPPQHQGRGTICCGSRPCGYHFMTHLWRVNKKIARLNQILGVD